MYLKRVEPAGYVITASDHTRYYYWKYNTKLIDKGLSL